MKPKKRQKLCYNCEGEIDLDVIVCPFCAADLREEKPEQQRPSYKTPAPPQAHQHTVESLYPPHYNPKPPADPSPLKEIAEEMVEPSSEQMDGKAKNIFGPTILFTLGVQLCLFGLLMVLFSHKGVLLLKWDARLWFLYVFASIPLLVFGYRSLSKL